jgi:hypothetical protein
VLPGWDWDFEQHCFVEGFDKVHSPIQIGRPFPARDEALIRQVHDRLLYPIWGDDAQLKAIVPENLLVTHGRSGEDALEVNHTLG